MSAIQLTVSPGNRAVILSRAIFKAIFVVLSLARINQPSLGVRGIGSQTCFTRRKISRILRYCSLLALILCCLAWRSSEAAQPIPEAVVKPNIVLILMDDGGVGDIGAFGSRDIKTPHIDALAARGVIATAGYSAAPMCTPARAGLMTGRYPQRYGVENNAGPSYPHWGLPLDETTMATTLKNFGYATGAIGKWHLGDDSQFHPNKRGFTYFYGFAKRCCHNYFSIAGDQPIQRNGVTVPDPDYTTTGFGADAAAFIRENQAQPFFLYVAFNAAHEPLQALPADLALYPNLTGNRKIYAAMVSALDREIGHIMGEVDKLSRPTLIIFLSDNGAATGGSNYPFTRGGKGTLLEGGIRTPFIMAMKGVLPAGRVVSVPVSQLDIFPTISALTGAPLPPKKLDGRNILPLMKGTVATLSRDLFFRYLGGPPWAIRSGNKKLMANVTGKETLFDLTGTQEKVISNPTIAAQLKQRYLKWDQQMIPPLWWPN
ncbi:conserved hypothetical protein [uncultured Defluviicoccus sp.]|uniref:Sulfatase N-terminal domain-containing protein n=1 Tax=metagenome TaxID=256318 RepID=A0A380TBQ9_9ZZZZ|nr:conserved hypothetical protein [uncultured Defluviicoccus sp.]